MTSLTKGKVTAHSFSAPIILLLFLSITTGTRGIPHYDWLVPCTQLIWQVGLTLHTGTNHILQDMSSTWIHPSLPVSPGLLVSRLASSEVALVSLPMISFLLFFKSKKCLLIHTCVLQGDLDPQVNFIG